MGVLCSGVSNLAVAEEIVDARGSKQVIERLTGDKTL
jgi:hypothetical protein